MRERSWKSFRILNKNVLNSPKQNVAIIIPGGIGTGRNNIGVPVLERIIRLLALEFEVTVFQLYPVNENFQVTGFELVPIYSGNPLLKCWKLFLAFRTRNRQKKFSVIHGFWAMPNGFMAVLLGKIFKSKSIVSVLGGDAIALPDINYGQLLNPLYRKLIFWTLRHAEEVNVLTSYLIRNLKKAGFERKDIKIIPWGVDTAAFSFREKAVGSPVKFLHVANLHPVKDQATMLRAFKIIHSKVSSQLVMIGEGDHEIRIKKLISDLGLQHAVTMLGLLPYEDLPHHYSTADVLLQTSLSEGQSEVVTEAMSCGVLVCGTQVGLMYDLPDCCVAVPVGDAERLGDEVVALLAAPERMAAIRARAKTWASAHSLRWTVDQIKLLYKTSGHQA
ncbi:MAG: glycosyltransferase [Bacteroidota bacterium]